MKTKRRYSLDEHCFDNLTNESAYWVGFVYGDGNCTRENKMRVEVAVKDKQHLVMLRSFMGTIDRPIKEITGERHHNAKLEVRSWKIHNTLSKYELTKRKENRGRLHFSLLQPEIRRHFMRGIFDADGSFYYQTKSDLLFSEITGRMPLLKDLKNVLVEDGVINETKKIVKNGSIFRIRMAGADTLRLINYLYDGEPQYKLHRKYAIAKQYRERLNVQTDKKSEATVQKEYHRPVESFNIGKQSEHKERKHFEMKEKK